MMTRLPPRGEREACYKPAAMEIAFVTTELAPFVKVGGLADVSAALPKALRALGHSVTVILPRFPSLEAQGLLLARRLTPRRFTLGDRELEATLFDGRLASQVDLLVIDVPGLFDRPGVYGEHGEDYPDNALRFAAFSKATAALLADRATGGQPFDVVHCNDWPTALLPTYLRAAAREAPSRSAGRIVLTIHNVAYQGIFPREDLPLTGLGWDAFRIDGVEFYGRINLLKLGILTADAVTTVSSTYASEIQTPEHGDGLDGVLRSRSEAVVGIVNGIDCAVWNPATDPALVARYDAENFSNKARSKGALQKELGLRLDIDLPLVGFVGRLVEQKGVDLVLGALPKLLRSAGMQVVVAGDGVASAVSMVEAAVARSDGRLCFVRAAPEPLVHRLFAAADIVLVPSRDEPCGLVQMYAQRYGAVPVARSTGGLIDTIVDCDAKLETGTGFLFDQATPEALLGAIERALAARMHPRWPVLVRRVMRLDRGWDRPARRYEQVYRSGPSR